MSPRSGPQAVECGEDRRFLSRFLPAWSRAFQKAAILAALHSLRPQRRSLGMSHQEKLTGAWSRSWPWYPSSIMAGSPVDGPMEVELKLQTMDEGLLDRIWELVQLGPFSVESRSRRRLHNRYLDSPDHALDRARGNLRWRTIDGETMAELTYKGPSEVHDGVFRRSEVTAQLPADANPLTVLPPPEPLLLARQFTQDLAFTELHLDCDRRALTLRSQSARVELALDITMMPDRDFHDLEIEAELLEGEVSALTGLEALIGSLGTVRRARKGKRARGWVYLKRARAARNA